MKLPGTKPIVLDVSSQASGGFRRWIRSDMLVLRWVFLALYVLIAGGLLLYSLSQVWRETFLTLALIGIVVAQFLMILGTGTVRLCHPIRRRRLVVPVVAAAFMMVVLTAGFLAAMWELFEIDETNIPQELVYFGFVGLSWIAWGALFFAYTRGRTRHTVLSRLTTYVFAGSLAELLATVPAHVIVSRRPGCLVGLATAFGIIAGICVMLASFGPMIVLLFLRPRARAEKAIDGTPYCPACGYDLRASRERCPECGLAFSEG